MSLNKVFLIGNVGRDPEVRYLDGNSAAGGTGTKVATFTLATSERYRDRSGELRENTEWHNIVAWRNSADIAEKFVHKGTQLFIEGRLRTRSYTDQQGVKKFTTEITVDNMQLLGKREGSDDSQAQGGFQRGPGQGGSYSQRPQGAGEGGWRQPSQGQQPVQQAPSQSQTYTEPDAGGADGSDDLPF